MPFPLTLEDARGREITLERPPRRIVSLVPSLTELLASLDLDDEVAGLTRFCVRPEAWQDTKMIVGGTKNVNVERVRALTPDLVLANQEENTAADVEALEATAPVYVTDVPDLPAALDMIRAIGRLTGRAERAGVLIAEIDARFAALPAFEPLRAAYLIWRAPYMSVGHDTFIHDVMARAGLVNAFTEETRYPSVTAEEIAEAGPAVLLCSTEPFPFHQKEAFTADLRAALPDVPVEIVDGQLFSWYGPRLLDTPAYLRALRADLAVALRP